MGFTKIAIVGADHEFSVKGPANSYISGIEEDNSHFDKSYFADVEWQLPDLVESEVGYLRAKIVLKVIIEKYLIVLRVEIRDFQET